MIPMLSYFPGWLEGAWRCVLEHVDQTPFVLADSYAAHDSVSLVNDEMSQGSNENLDAQVRNENLASTNDKILVMI